MAIQYALKGAGMEEQPFSMVSKSKEPVVQVTTRVEFERECAPALNHPIAMQTIARSQACHADLFDTCTSGVIALPDKHDLLAKPRIISFYIDVDRVIIADDNQECADVVRELAHTPHQNEVTAARILFLVMDALLIDDAAFLEDYEERLESVEEKLTEMDRAKANHAITQVRRELLRLDYYYEQMESIGELLAENANELFSDQDARLFNIFAHHADRLFDRTRTLKEYSLQLYQLQQTQLDIRLNETMRWLTVVTSIFVPLTLITSWYGMNFAHMPELDWVFGYPLLIVICLTIIVFELLYFKRRKWL